MTKPIFADLTGLGFFTELQGIIREGFAAHGCKLLEGKYPLFSASVIHCNREAITDTRLADCVQGISTDIPWIVELAFPGANLLVCFAGASYREVAETLREQLEPTLLQPIFEER